MLALAAIFYAVASWMVAPGFYDGFGPTQPYNWTCPPPQAGANLKPSSGHLVIKVIDGSSDPNSAFTDDGQLVIGFLPGAFMVDGKTSITVDVTPLDSCPQPPGVRFVTNVYDVKASAPLDPQKSANLVLIYSNLEPDPSDIYQAPAPDGPWTKLPRSQQGVRILRRRVRGDIGTAWCGDRRRGPVAADHRRGADRVGRARRAAAGRHAPTAIVTGEGRLVVFDRFEDRAASLAPVLKRHRLGAEEGDDLGVLLLAMGTARHFPRPPGARVSERGRSWLSLSLRSARTSSPPVP